MRGLESLKKEVKWGEVKVAQTFPALCNPRDYTVHGILQATILECIVIPFSTGSSQPRKRTLVSHIAGGFFTSWATREDQKKEVDHCRLVGGTFKKQENLLTRLVLDGFRITDLHTPPARIVKFIQRTELGSVMYTVQTVSAQQDYFRVLSLGSFWREEGKQNTHSKDGEGVGGLQWPESSSWVTCSPRSPPTLLLTTKINRIWFSPIVKIHLAWVWSFSLSKELLPHD